MGKRTSAFLAVVLLVALVGVAVPAPAEAIPAVNLACPPDIVDDAGFADVDPASVHKANIDCLAWYGITAGTSPTTFDPKAAVTRWQMALFLIRTLDVMADDYVSGTDQGFTDIAALSGEAQLAVNKLGQLSITAGTSPTTYGPAQEVTRWQMALFLTRMLRAAGVSLPDGSAQGFGDIGHLSADTQQAINRLKQLGITAGTSATTFGPDGSVTREQMASFLARTLTAGGDVLFLTWGSGSCDDDGNCTLEGTFPANTGFVHRYGWHVTPLPVPPENQEFFTDSDRVELTWNGDDVVLAESLITLNDIVLKWYEAAFPTGLSGQHTFEITWYDSNVLVQTWTVTITFE